MKVNCKMFKLQANRVKQFCTSILGNVTRLTIKNGEMVITSSDGAKRINATLQVDDSSVDKTVYLNGDTLARILSLCNSEELNLSIINNEFIIDSDKETYSLELLDGDNMPFIPELTGTDMCADELIDAIKKVSYRVPPKGFNQLLLNVYLNQVGDNVEVVGTNSFVLKRIKVKGMISNPIFIPQCILSSIEESIEPIFIKVEDRYLHFVYSTFNIGALTVNGSFPDYNKLFDAENDIAVLDISSCKEILDDIKKISVFSDNVLLSCKDGENIMYIDTIRKRNKVKSNIVYKGEDKDVCISIKYLQGMLKDLDKCTLRISNSYIFVDVDENDCTLARQFIL